MEQLYLSSSAQAVLLVAAVVGATAFLVSQKKKKKYNLPPGPSGLPIIGNLSVFTKNPYLHEAFIKLTETYGDVFYLNLAGRRVISINNIKLAREALITKQNDFAGRPQLFSGDIFTSGSKAITTGQFSPVWKQQRKIAHEAIRKYASGDHLEILINNSFSDIAERFQKLDKPFNPIKYMSLLIYNVICAMCFGERFELDDPFMTKFIEMIDDLNDTLGNGFLADVFPIVQYFPNKNIAKVKAQMHDVEQYLESNIKKHEENFDPENISDLTYHILHHKNTLGTVAENGESLTKDHFVQILSDVFFAGTDTTRYTLTWLLAYMAKHPDIQKKLQNHIDEVIGTGQVGLRHRNSIPYVTAVLQEVMRIRTLVLNSIPHETTCDTSVGGYDVPKGTMVMVNLHAIHHDPRTWKSPEEFNPERFFDEDGNLAPKPEYLMPFSAGRRVCVGEVLAKAELHMTVTLLFQRFSFAFPEGEIFDMSAIPNGLFNIPNNFNLVVKERF